MSEIFCNDGSCATALWYCRLFAAAFLSILFLQSGFDKIVDRQGNLDWLTGHFAESPLAGTVPTLLSVITGVELLAGGFSGLGALAVLLTGGTGLAFAGAVFSAAALVMLFFGQRLAKDYEGAAVLVPYFILSLLAILLFA